MLLIVESRTVRTRATKRTLDAAAHRGRARRTSFAATMAIAFRNRDNAMDFCNVQMASTRSIVVHTLARTAHAPAMMAFACRQSSSVIEDATALTLATKSIATALSGANARRTNLSAQTPSAYLRAIAATVGCLLTFVHIKIYFIHFR